jgi:hypothetical protein
MVPYQRIRPLEFTDLPKTISGRIRRAELRNLQLDRLIAEVRRHEFFKDVGLLSRSIRIVSEGIKPNDAFTEARCKRFGGDGQVSIEVGSPKG